MKDKHVIVSDTDENEIKKQSFNAIREITESGIDDIEQKTRDGVEEIERSLDKVMRQNGKLGT